MTPKLPRIRLLRNRPLRLALTGVAAIALLAGAAATAPGSTIAGKRQDRMPQTGAAAVRLAAIDPETAPIPDAPPPAGAPRGGPLALARNLAAAETAVGIRPGQMEAWRDFTDALQDALPPPPPGHAPPPATAAGTPPEPFALIRALAARDAAAGPAGARLTAALDTLRSRLSAEQLARFARIEPALLPPPPGAPRDRLPPR